VLRSKVCQVKCVEMQSVPGSKMIWGAKCSSAIQQGTVKQCHHYFCHEFKVHHFRICQNLDSISINSKKHYRKSEPQHSGAYNLDQYTYTCWEHKPIFAGLHHSNLDRFKSEFLEFFLLDRPKFFCCCFKLWQQQKLRLTFGV
jgi:hypothetical protein